jgi:hypothetical protein
LARADGVEPAQAGGGEVGVPVREMPSAAEIALVVGAIAEASTWIGWLGDVAPAI